MKLSLRLLSLMAGLLFGSGVLMAGEKPVFSLSTTAVKGRPETGFSSGLVSVGRLDRIYGAPDGENNPRSFPFTWTGLPEGTKALALVLDDPDAKPVMAYYGEEAEFFLHWIAADIDPKLGGLADNAAAKATFPQGVNDTGEVGYQSPAPPADIPKDTKKARIHVYRLTVYALKAPTGLKAGFTLEELEEAIADTTLGVAQLNVSYSNQ